MNTEDSEALRKKAIVALARETRHRDGDLEIDDDAVVSEGNDNGCYVAAWVWIGFDGTQLNKGKSA